MFHAVYLRSPAPEEPLSDITRSHLSHTHTHTHRPSDKLGEALFISDHVRRCKRPKFGQGFQPDSRVPWTWGRCVIMCICFPCQRFRCHSNPRRESEAVEARCAEMWGRRVGVKFGFYNWSMEIVVWWLSRMISHCNDCPSADVWFHRLCLRCWMCGFPLVNFAGQSVIWCKVSVLWS